MNNFPYERLCIKLLLPLIAITERPKKIHPRRFLLQSLLSCSSNTKVWDPTQHQESEI